MLKENWRLISRIERIGDNLIIVLSFIFAYYGRSSLIYWDRKFGWALPFAGEKLAPLPEYLTVLGVALISYNVILNVIGAYESMRINSTWKILREFLFASLLVFFTLAATLFTFKIDVSRSFVSLFCLLSGITLYIERCLVLQVLRIWRKQGRNYRSVVISGLGPQALKLAGEIAARPELGLRIVGFAALGDEDFSRVEEFRSTLGGLKGLRVKFRFFMGTDQLKRMLKRNNVDEVIFTEILPVMSAVEEMIIVCGEQGVRTTIAADLFSVGIMNSGISYFAGMPLIHYQTPPGDRWDLAVKRAFDIAFSGLMLLVLAPVFAMIALAVKLDSSGPVLFRQRRVGLNGRLFTMLKFRSMKVHAERELAALEELNEMEGPVFKIRNDPRITRVGRFLRRFSLDELPQLWNVFVGDMSLVGPRPPVPGEVNKYQRRYRRRLSMRPGLTCTWQVSGRNEIKDFESWVKLDLEYIDNWSLTKDFQLLCRTVPAVIFGTGA